MITDDQWADLLATRATDPAAIRRAYQLRRRRTRLLSDQGTLFLVAADHPARGSLGVGGDPLAMADRRSLLTRLLTALANPAVDGVLGTPDVIEELLLLDALHDKVVIGSMNRGGLAGADWEIDDRFTAYDPTSIAGNGLDGGKMLLRLVDSDPGTVPTLESCAAAVSALAERRLMAMVEPLPYARNASGELVLQKDPAALARAGSVAAGLGVTSAYTWLKLPPSPDEVLGATTLPALVLGGVPSARLSDDLASWGRSLRHPTVRGLVIGRALLYPPDGDVAGAVDAAARVLRSAREGAGRHVGVSPEQVSAGHGRGRAAGGGVESGNAGSDGNAGNAGNSGSAGSAGTGSAAAGPNVVGGAAVGRAALGRVTPDGVAGRRDLVRPGADGVGAAHEREWRSPDRVATSPERAELGREWAGGTPGSAGTTARSAGTTPGNAGAPRERRQP